MTTDRIRFTADSDDATRTIKTRREVWKHKPASARGRRVTRFRPLMGRAVHGEWQTRTPPGTYGLKNGELIRATEGDLALKPLTPDEAVKAFRNQSEKWARHYTAQANTRLASAAKHREEALWPASEEND